MFGLGSCTRALRNARQFLMAREILASYIREVVGTNIKNSSFGDFSGGLVVKIHASHAGDSGSILGKGTKIPHASRLKNQNIKLKQCSNKFNKDFKNGPH